jgi:hypothetical protein
VIVPCVFLQPDRNPACKQQGFAPTERRRVEGFHQDRETEDISVEGKAGAQIPHGQRDMADSPYLGHFTPIIR